MDLNKVVDEITLFFGENDEFEYTVKVTWRDYAEFALINTEFGGDKALEIAASVLNENDLVDYLDSTAFEDFLREKYEDDIAQAYADSQEDAYDIRGLYD